MSIRYVCVKQSLKVTNVTFKTWIPPTCQTGMACPAISYHHNKRQHSVTQSFRLELAHRQGRANLSNTTMLKCLSMLWTIFTSLVAFNYFLRSKLYDNVCVDKLQAKHRLLLNLTKSFLNETQSQYKVGLNLLLDFIYFKITKNSHVNLK